MLSAAVTAHAGLPSLKSGMHVLSLLLITNCTVPVIELSQGHVPQAQCGRTESLISAARLEAAATLRWEAACSSP